MGHSVEIRDLLYLDNVQYRDVVVEIERSTIKKPFLGGYRHKQTGAEYHHATAQTIPKVRPQSAVQRFCRDTQTTQQRHIRQQTANETSTQMTQIGTYVSSQQDRLLEPRRYTSADEHHQHITDKAVLLHITFLNCGEIVTVPRQDNYEATTDLSSYKALFYRDVL